MADDLVKRINSAIDVLQAVADGAAAFDKSGAPPVMGLLTEAIASLATKDAEIANLRADLLARREAERKVIEAEMAWQEAIATEGIAADESVSLCDAMDALAALAEQEAKGDDRG